MGNLDFVLFDLDGTLWDTADTCTVAWNEALHALGMAREMTRSDLTSIMGLTHGQIFSKLFPDLDADLRERLSAECYRREEACLERLGGKLFPRVADGLTRLAGRYRLGIVSNCQRGYVEQFFRLTGLGRHFADHECHGNTGRSKGENIRLLMERLEATHAIFVGDTRGDEEAARFAGLPFYFVEYGFGQCDRADVRLSSFDQLDRLLREAA